MAPCDERNHDSQAGDVSGAPGRRANLSAPAASACSLHGEKALASMRVIRPPQRRRARTVARSTDSPSGATVTRAEPPGERDAVRTSGPHRRVGPPVASQPSIHREREAGRRTSGPSSQAVAVAVADHGRPPRFVGEQHGTLRCRHGTRRSECVAASAQPVAGAKKGSPRLTRREARIPSPDRATVVGASRAALWGVQLKRFVLAPADQGHRVSRGSAPPAASGTGCPRAGVRQQAGTGPTSLLRGRCGGYRGAKRGCAKPPSGTWRAHRAWRRASLQGPARGGRDSWRSVRPSTRHRAQSASRCIRASSRRFRGRSARARRCAPHSPGCPRRSRAGDPAPRARPRQHRLRVRVPHDLHRQLGGALRAPAQMVRNPFTARRREE